MRIIITNNGIKEVASLSPVIRPQRINQTAQFPLRSNILSHSFSAPSMITMNTAKNEKISQYGLNSSVDLSLMQPKVIKVKQTKIKLPKEKSELYDLDKSTNTTIVKQLPDIYLSLSSSQTSSNTLPMLKNKYSLKEIINEKVFQKLDTKIKQDQYINNHDLIVDYTSFRKQRNDQKVFDEIEKDKKKEIDANNSNLIEYLMGKTTISDKMLKNLNDYNEKRINRINKICQKILVKKEQDANFIKDVQQKMKNKEIAEQEECHQKLKKMNIEICKFYQKLTKEKNLRSVNKKEIFASIHKDFSRKYWKKNNNFQRFFRFNRSKSTEYL